MKKNFKLSVTAVLLLTAAALTTACGQSSAQSQNTPASAQAETASQTAASTVGTPSSFTVNTISNHQNTIQVNSSEHVTVIPDIAEVVYAVRTEARDAASCQQSNTQDTNQVIELLKSLGIAETSIQTSDYYMYPIYNYSGNTQKITGYEATTTLTVSDLPIENLEHILTESVSVGINSIQSITYQSSTYDQAYEEALKLAVASARKKAEVLAEAGGCTLGGVASIRENSSSSEARYTDNALTSKILSIATTEELAADSVSSIMPGEVDIEVNITVEYFL